MPRKSTTFTPQQDSEIIRLRCGGATYKEIAAATRHSRSGVRRRYLQLQKAIALAKAHYGSGNPVIDEINSIQPSKSGFWNAPIGAGEVARGICNEHNKSLRAACSTVEVKLRLQSTYIETLEEKNGDIRRDLNVQIEKLEVQKADLEFQVQSLQHENDKLRGNVNYIPYKIRHHLRVDIGAYNAVARALIDIGWHTAFTRDRGVLVLDMNGLGIAVDGGEDEGEAA